MLEGDGQLSSPVPWKSSQKGRASFALDSALEYIADAAGAIQAVGVPIHQSVVFWPPLPLPRLINMYVRYVACRDEMVLVATLPLSFLPEIK